jgi:hypothetical protein
MIKKQFFLSLSFSIIAASFSASAQSPGAVTLSADAPRQTILFDRAWQFHQGEAAGADQPDFDD